MEWDVFHTHYAANFGSLDDRYDGVTSWRQWIAGEVNWGYLKSTIDLIAEKWDGKKKPRLGQVKKAYFDAFTKRSSAKMETVRREADSERAYRFKKSCEETRRHYDLIKDKKAFIDYRLKSVDEFYREFFESEIRPILERDGYDNPPEDRFLCWIGPLVNFLPGVELDPEQDKIAREMQAKRREEQRNCRHCGGDGVFYCAFEFTEYGSKRWIKPGQKAEKNGYMVSVPCLCEKGNETNEVEDYRILSNIREKMLEYAFPNAFGASQAICVWKSNVTNAIEVDDFVLGLMQSSMNALKSTNSINKINKTH